MIRVIPPDAGHRLPILVWGRVVADIPDFCRELVEAFVQAKK